MAKRFDGITSQIGGMDEGRHATLLENTRYRRGVNISVRGGLVKTRPVWKKVDVDLADGKFQGAGNFHLNSADRLVFAIGGTLYNYNTSTGAITTYANTRDATSDRYHFVQADQYFIAQDGTGTNRPLILNYTGDDPDTDIVSSDDLVPAGTIMAYGHGRIFVVLEELGDTNVGERFMAAGDIFKPNDPQSVLSFTETDYLSEGGAIALPYELGRITALNFIRNVQSGTGLGSLIAMALHGACAFQINAERRVWKDLDFSQVLFTQHEGGTNAPNTFIAVNNDLIMRSLDGIRSIGYTVATTAGEGASLNNEPISNEVIIFMELDDETDMPFMSMAHVNSRTYLTANAQTVSEETIFKSVISLDGSPINSLGRSASAAYNGIWTGLNFTHILTALRDDKLTLFAFHKTDTGGNELYYIDESDTEYVDATDSRPVCRLYTRSMDFQNEGTRIGFLKLDYMELWLTDILGELDVTIYYRPTGYPLWNACNTMSIKATDGSLAQRYRKIQFKPETDTVCDDASGESLQIDTDFEFCIQFTGHATIQKAMFVTDEQQREIKLACQLDDTAQDLQAGDSGVLLDDFSYEIS